MAETVQNRTDLFKKRDAPLVSEGVHPAELADVVTFENAFGERVGLVFRIDGGEFSGAEVLESATAKDSGRGKLASLLRCIGGGHSVEQARKAIGRRCKISIRHELTRQGKPYAAITQTFI